MSVTTYLTVAVRGSKSDIKDLHKRLIAFENEGKITMDYRTFALTKMLDDWNNVFFGIKLKSPTVIEFTLEWEGNLPLGRVIGRLKEAYDDAEVFFYLSFVADHLPIVYDPEQDVFEFEEPVFYLDEDFDPEEDEIPWDEYKEWCENLPDYSDDSDEATYELIMEKREEIIGVRVVEIEDGGWHIESTEEEVVLLEGESTVSVYNKGKYYPSRCAIAKWSGDIIRHGTKRVCIDISEAMWQYYDVIEAEWETTNDYGNKLEDFVIKKFDMKITKGKVKIQIELGA